MASTPAPATTSAPSKSAPGGAVKDRVLIAVIGDEDTVTGLLLAGIGQTDSQKNASNFLIVDNKTPIPTIEQTFRSYLARKDLAVILINQHVAEWIRLAVDSHRAPFPTVLEIPSKDHPYDPEKDSVLKRVAKLFSAD